jgi:acetyltransferase-like isoleucine patch superfamily enzyme
VRSVVIGHFKGSVQRARGEHKPSVRIEDNVFVGPGVTILPNVIIGEGAVVSAGSVVNHSVPPQTMVQGNPAQVVARCGVPFKGHSYEEFVRNLVPAASVGRPPDQPIR